MQRDGFTGPDQLDAEGEPDAEHHVEQLAAEAGAETGSGLAAPRHGRVGDQVADGVAPGQHREAEDRVGQPEDDPNGLEERNQLVGDDVDPHHGHTEPDEPEHWVVHWRHRRSGIN